jgi:putative peptidoglycan lipid II flippase
VVLGAVLHVVVQLPFLIGQKAEARPPLRETLRRMREVLVLSVPRTAALAAGQLSLLMLTAIASLMVKGSITIFTFAYNLQAVPLAIIGVSYSVAAFPTLSRLHASGERTEFIRHIETALRHMVFWAIPATVLVIVLRAQLVRTILGSGAFDWEATRLVAAALALFIISLAAQSITLLIARAYYAAGNTGKPLIFAALSVGTAVASAVLLTAAFNSSDLWRHFLEMLFRVEDIPGTTVLMLALAYALGALVQTGVGLWTFSRDFGVSLRPLFKLVFQSFAASVIGGTVAYGVLALFGRYIDINTVMGIFTQGAVAGICGLAATGVVLALLGNTELLEAYRAIRERLAPSPVALESTEVS